MHIQDKSAPKPGDHVYRVDSEGGPQLHDSLYVVIYIGTEVLVIKAKDPLDFDGKRVWIDTYEPDQFFPTYEKALVDAARKLEAKATHALEMSKKYLALCPAPEVKEKK